MSGVDARAIPLPPGQNPAQLWREVPTMLRTLLDVADAAPTAGVAVVENTVRDLAPGLRAGDAGAYEEFAAAVDTVVAGLTNDQDRAQLNGYADAAVDRLRNRTNRVDEVNQVNQRGITAESAPTSPSTRKELGPAARGGDPEATASRANASGYDRATSAALTSFADSEAAAARHASSPGFSRPTRDMLAEAQARTSGPSAPHYPACSSLGRGRAPRR